MDTKRPLTPSAFPPLRAVREARGLSLRETARRAEITAAQLSRVERGEVSLSIGSLARLGRVLGLKELVSLITPYERRSRTDDDE